MHCEYHGRCRDCLYNPGCKLREHRAYQNRQLGIREMFSSQRLQEAVKKSGLVHSDIAEICNISVSALRSYLAGTRTPTTKTIAKLVNGLDLEAEDLLEGIG